MIIRCRLVNDREQWLANVIIVREEQLASFIGTLILKNADALTSWVYPHVEDLDPVIADLAKRAGLQDYYDYEVLDNIEF